VPAFQSVPCLSWRFFLCTILQQTERGPLQSALQISRNRWGDVSLFLIPRRSRGRTQQNHPCNKKNHRTNSVTITDAKNRDNRYHTPSNHPHWIAETYTIINKDTHTKIAVEGQYTHSVPIQNIIPGKKQQYTPLQLILQLILDTWPSTSRDIYKINDNYNH